MEVQHQVILSLGSNQGNRLENIKQCIDLIHQEIGDVIKVSSLYETPSWGFESDSFYNCALILQTSYSPHEILDKVLKVERNLGRIRGGEQGYQARVIDVDLIAYDDKIVNTENLQIPHPLMQNRNFVLLPIRDLNLNWIHPVLKKSILELLQLSPDKSECLMIQQLDAPL
jgi:deoxyguanosine kinase